MLPWELIHGQWHPIFDGHVEVQKAAALSSHSADSNKSEIAIVCDTEDAQMAKTFAASAVSTRQDKGWCFRHPNHLLP
jgi:hypothetical protein